MKTYTNIIGLKSFWRYFFGLCLILSMAFLTQRVAEAQSGDRVHPADSLALVALYHATHGDTWINNSGWLTSDPIDTWAGIDRVENVGTEQDPEWRVTRIRMPNENMTRSAELPIELGNMEYLQQFRWDEGLLTGGLEVFEGLPRLEIIYFRNQVFLGEIPFDIYKELPVLRQIQIRNSPQYAIQSKLVGQIPPSIGDFPRLTHLYLMNNQLSGSLPPELANLSTLQHLNVTWNLFTGEWPDLGNLPDLHSLELWANPFEPGPIPEWIRNLSSTLINLRIFDTNRTGVVPEWITELSLLSSFDVGNGIWKDETSDPNFHNEEMLGGTLPDLSGMPNLVNLRIHGRNFTGPIPSWIANIPSLNRLYLIDTGFEGPIPGNIFTTAQELQRVYIFNNKNLTGGLPAEMQTATNLERVLIAYNPNMEVGEFPSWLGNLTNMSDFDLRGMKVTGDFPAELSNWTSLEILEIGDNPGITGPIPTWLEDKNLERFDISRTGMDVPEVPTWLQSQAGINRLGLAGLGISGSLPDWLGDLQYISHLSLDDNEFTGALPASLGNLSLMDSLSLGNNQFSGELPVEFANLGRVSDNLSLMKTLSLSGNENLSGPLPMGLTDFSYMRSLEYDGTGLCDPDSPSFFAWLDSIPANEFQQYPYKASKVQGTNILCSTVSIEPGSQPYVFRLSQNYPNPFNPTTTIRYEIPVDAHVSLNVYNMLGQLVATLVNDNQVSGQHQVNFNGQSLSSGSYFYRLQAGDRVQTQTMMLIK